MIDFVDEISTLISSVCKWKKSSLAFRFVIKGIWLNAAVSMKGTDLEGHPINLGFDM